MYLYCSKQLEQQQIQLEKLKTMRMTSTIPRPVLSESVQCTLGLTPDQEAQLLADLNKYKKIVESLDEVNFIYDIVWLKCTRCHADYLCC